MQTSKSLTPESRPKPHGNALDELQSTYLVIGSVVRRGRVQRIGLINPALIVDRGIYFSVTLSVPARDLIKDCLDSFFTPLVFPPWQFALAIIIQI